MDSTMFRARFFVATIVLQAFLSQVIGMETLGFSLEKFEEAYKLACDYEHTFDCQSYYGWVGDQAYEEDERKSIPEEDSADMGNWTLQDVLPKISSEKLKGYFLRWIKRAGLPRLPKVYQEKCEKFVADEDAKPAADESEILKDVGKEYIYKALAHCLVATLREISNGTMAKDWSMLYYGMDKAILAYDMVCDYLQIRDCKGEQALRKKQVLAESDMSGKPEQQMDTFGWWSRDALVKLPKPYQEKCEQFLFMQEIPEFDEGKELKDDGKTYPFKAYSHCLVHTLREISGGAMKKNA